MPKRPHRRSREPLQCGSIFLKMAHHLLSLPVCTSRCSSSPGISWFPRKSFLLVEDGIQAPDLASKCIHCFWDGTALQHIWQTELGICALCPASHINFSVYIFKNHVFILTRPVPIPHRRTHPNFALGYL